MGRIERGGAVISPGAAPGAAQPIDVPALADSGSPADDPMFALGVDTGGTFTDAVLYDERTRTVVAKAKAPTTHDDLAVGITGAIEAVLASGSAVAGQISLVSVSTTLATNALVEGRGRAIGLVVIGFEREIVERAGLAAALGSDPVVFLAGGHDAHGNEVAGLDVDGLDGWLGGLSGHLEGFAVAAQFSVRNPAHERAARDLIRGRTGRPVSCSHELSAQLNGPKRAVTAVLNARLIPIIDQLVTTMRSTLAAKGIEAPLMAVRGDGSLVSASFVSERPIETILSGPAASLVGAAHLTGLDEAVISDIGGTTTDIAVLRRGRPVISTEGAVVGGHRTMVTAVAMHTHGLGGDSELRVDGRAMHPRLLIGPRRVIPLSQLAMEHAEAVATMLDRQLLDIIPPELAGTMIVPTATGRARTATGRAEAELLAVVAGGPLPLTDLPPAVARRSLIDRLVREGMVQLAAFTPTDAAHALGLHDHLDASVVGRAAELFARHRTARGGPFAPDGPQAAAAVVAALVRRSAEAVLAAALVEDGLAPQLATSTIVARALDRIPGVVRTTVGLDVPLVGLGASASTYYPAVAALLGARSVVPDDADVANAVGAVVGRITITREVAVTSPTQGRFTAHLDAPVVHPSVGAARSAAEAHLRSALAGDMAAAGAGEYETTVAWDETVVDVGGLLLFVSGRLRVTGSGRPRLDLHRIPDPASLSRPPRRQAQVRPGDPASR